MNYFHIDKATYKLLKKERTNIDRATLLVGIIAPLATIPQIITIFSEQNVAGVSIFTWSFYLFSASLALIYSIVHRLPPFIVSSALWVMADALVVAGCLIYG